MKKINIPDVTKYLREVSVVVIGVAITLIASYWLSNSREKRDMALYLNAIKLELQENIQYVDFEIDYLVDWTNYGRYLLSLNKKPPHPDSLRTDAYPGLGAIHNLRFQTSAFEIFKVSNTMQLMDDKELLQSIWKTYFVMERVGWTVDKYYELKWEHGLQEGQRDLAGEPSPIPLYDFFIIGANFGAVERCQEVSELLKETLAKIEKRG